MHFKYRNVNTAFRGLVTGFHDGSIKLATVPSRVGERLMVEEPVIVTFDQPRERVLFNTARDCNPFFHLYESMWMLAGRQDIAPLEYYSSGYKAQVDDGGPNANGAYGYRWRKSRYWDSNQQTPGDPWIAEVDQLAIIIDQLRRKPESSRVVLQMWNVEDDLMKMDTTKDCCCNTHAYFLVEDGRYLNMSVCNRSNDMIWGMLGANVVHFSFLQEYLAAAIGLQVGAYHQITNNLHVYSSRWEPLKWLTENKCDYDYSVGEYDAWNGAYPLVLDPATFDREVKVFADKAWGGQSGPHRLYNEPFLQRVAWPMCIAFAYHKQREYDQALNALSACVADDWRVAGTNWIMKRKAMWEAKNA